MKVGKTTFAAQAPKSLLLAFEKGYSAIAGLNVVDIEKWSDFKLVLRQLEKKEAKEKYDIISIDTVSEAWGLCTQFICKNHGVAQIGEIPYGKGYQLRDEEFNSALRKIPQLGYGRILITHSKEITRTTEVLGEEGKRVSVDYTRLKPDLDDRCMGIVNKMVDLILCIGVEYDPEDPYDTGKRFFYSMGNASIMAGSRFGHIPRRFPFGYDELGDALAEAIEKESQITGIATVEKSERTSQRTFDDVASEGRELWSRMVEVAGISGAEKILDTIRSSTGQDLKLSELEESHQELFEILNLQMQDIIDKSVD